MSDPKDKAYLQYQEQNIQYLRLAFHLTLLRETEGSLNIDKKVYPHHQQRNAVNISKYYYSHEVFMIWDHLL